MVDQSQAISQTAESPAGTLKFQPAFPMTNGRLAMLLFLSTEVMFFTAILGAYFVLRIPHQNTWPSQAVVHVDQWIGWLNTLVLLASCVSLWIAKKRAASDSAKAAKFWVLITLVLAVGFLVIKGFEYNTKIHHGLYPNGLLIHEKADQDYLSATVKEIGQVVAKLESEVGTYVDESHLESVNLIRYGVIEWTQHKVGKSSDRLTRQRAIEVMAHQIKPLMEGGEVATYLGEESKQVNEARDQLQIGLDQTNELLTASQSKLRELSKQKETDPSLEDQFAEESRLAEALTEKIGDIRKEMLPLTNRLEAVSVLNEIDGGINDLEGVLLPMVIPAGKTWANTYFLLTGFHLLHLIAGLGVLLVWVFIRIGKNRVQLLENFSLYWHFVDFVWLVIFAIIYLN